MYNDKDSDGTGDGKQKDHVSGGAVQEQRLVPNDGKKLQDNHYDCRQYGTEMKRQSGF